MTSVPFQHQVFTLATDGDTVCLQWYSIYWNIKYDNLRGWKKQGRNSCAMRHIQFRHLQYLESSLLRIQVRCSVLYFCIKSAVVLSVSSGLSHSQCSALIYHGLKVIGSQINRVLIKLNLWITAPRGAKPVNQTSANDWQMAERRDNVISITFHQV